MDMNEAKEVSEWNKNPTKLMWHPYTEESLDWAISQVEAMEEGNLWKRIRFVEAERDRLAAENAELRARAARWKRIARLEFRKFRDWKEYGEGRRADLTAANATLDALREVFSHECTWGALACPKARAILYPQPAALAEENDNADH